MSARLLREDHGGIFLHFGRLASGRSEKLTLAHPTVSVCKLCTVPTGTEQYRYISYCTSTVSVSQQAAGNQLTHARLHGTYRYIDRWLISRYTVLYLPVQFCTVSYAYSPCNLSLARYATSVLKSRRISRAISCYYSGCSLRNRWYDTHFAAT